LFSRRFHHVSNRIDHQMRLIELDKVSAVLHKDMPAVGTR
jgi:hypothetical protein